MCDGMADIPEESNVDTESDGVALGEYGNYSDGDHDEENFSDGDHDNDEDYVAPKQPESDDEQNKPEEEEILETAPKRKKKQV
jgi:hypothetical protein